MENFINSLLAQHKNLWAKGRLLLLLGGILWFLSALLIQHFAYIYVDKHVEGVAVGDLLLNNLPTVNLDFLVVQLPLILTLIIVLLFVSKPRYLPFSLKTLALFLIIRSFFISLTHLGASLHQLSLNENSIGFGIYDFLYNSKNDFFFSGHVGVPFLLGLIFWKEKLWSVFFFTVSAVFGITMILAHMHYSIDVFAAPFITYTIFVISKKIFKADVNLTNSVSV